MTIATEPIGSLPRSATLMHALTAHAQGTLDDRDLAKQQEQAVADTLAQLERVGSPVLVDGEQSKPSFATYPVTGLDTLSPDGAVIPFADGHTRQLPSITQGPFRYQVRAETYLRAARQFTDRPLKQAVIAPSALSLLYPATPIEGYPREEFL
ncbi:5-methyltetrahydropteroyltriglutamate--homocysteine methyltransferase, partial [Kitasatospora sp. NPDC058032]